MKTNVTIQANAHSTRRTRNRIREHGPHFRGERSSGGVHGLEGLCWLVRAKDGWHGWLPCAEFSHVGTGE